MDSLVRNNQAELGHASHLVGAIWGASLPCAVIDLDAFDRNVTRLARMTQAGRHVRLATKSIRVPELIERAMKASPQFKGLMTYSVNETRFLAAQGFDDFLIAYPTLQESDLAMLSELVAGKKTVRLVVDSEAHVAKLESLWVGAAKLPVVVEADASLRLLGGRIHLGVRRSPVRSADAVVQLAKRVGASSKLSFAGVMVYEAQVAGLPDRNPFKRILNPAAHLVRKLSVKYVAKFRREIAEALQASGIPLELFNGGGSGSLSYIGDESWLTEVTAGSALFCSHLFDYYSNLDFEPAAFFALQVVRSSDEGFVTCQGGGYIASGEAGPDRSPRPWYPEGLKLTGSEGAGEVQTPLICTDSNTMPKLGEPVLFRHAKAGELMERFSEVLLVSGDRIVGTARTYRGNNFTTY